jgi:hypothetical protein
MKLQVNHRSAEFTEILSIIQAGRAKAFEAVNVALAVGSTSSPLTPEQRKNLLPREVHDAVALYLSGKIDQWYWRQDGKGIVFLMNVSTVEEAQSLLDKLPFGESKILSFELIPLGPLSPLRVLLNSTSPTPAK